MSCTNVTNMDDVRKKIRLANLRYRMFTSMLYIQLFLFRSIFLIRSCYIQIDKKIQTAEFHKTSKFCAPPD